jgi:microcystin-dependent protein
MSDPFLGEIRMFGGSFAPRSWALCNGAILPISQNTMLFRLLGTNFGGNGTTNFALPNLVDNVPLGAGAGAGLSPYAVGQQVGSNSVLLDATTMPLHTHALLGNFNPADIKVPDASTVLSRSSSNVAYAVDSGTTFDTMDPSCLPGFAGGGLPHNNIQPFLAVTFIIALEGELPRRP